MSTSSEPVSRTIITISLDDIELGPIGVHQHDIDDGTLCILNVDTSDTQGPVGLTIRADTDPSPTLRMMMDTVARVARDFSHT